ncbi:diguanylate cyclase (GGDEF)-like protein [Ochrobactrum daejeonense]|uniref:diguanylate cyclase n=1 Tax=Brucella daejeonensis TaxID=659015 RepID=A0A7W9AXR9_9HYPH|nr:GGDEF domain-containing protein [Brucella daejeonensis]MBB5702184.1 diguanylate cyclase (GGDEF)-like protein [Brucella daejeonensis]
MFFAAGICSLAVAFTILSVWYQNPRDRFLFWGCLGMILLGAGAVLYYAGPFSLETASIVAFGLETAGFLFLYVGARQISGRVVPGGLLTAFAIIVVCAVALPVLGGWAGIGTAVFNIAVAALLVMTAREYIHVLREAPIPVAGMIVLYVLTALSFFLCGAVIIHERQWVLTDIPVNWAEDLNAITAIIGITGIGALSLSFTQSRIARRHANDARTDSLTGLLNRRALYDLLSKDELRLGDSVVVFDLDAFKSINDTHGHMVGDGVLCAFSDILRNHIDVEALVARIGGEEFVLVLRQRPHTDVLSLADAIRKSLSLIAFDTQTGGFTTTTSAGIAFYTPGDRDFQTVFRRADTALYRAKHLGRNKVCTELHSVA